MRESSDTGTRPPTFSLLADFGELSRAAPRRGEFFRRSPAPQPKIAPHFLPKPPPIKPFPQYTAAIYV
jgi:hypothetical protein